MKVYLAASLFTQAERIWLRNIAACLSKVLPEVALYLPQNEDHITSTTDPLWAKKLFERLREQIEACDLVLAIFDGPDVDSGTSWECGYAKAKGRKIIGVRTDMRGGRQNVNLMLKESCDEIICVDAQDENMEMLVETIASLLRRYRTIAEEKIHGS